MCRGTSVPDGDRHSLTFADGRPRVDVAGEILVRAVKTERFALRSALQEVTTHHVLNTLSSPDSQRSHRFAIDDFIAWYCSEPRLALNKTVVLRYKLQLEARHYALGKLRTGLPDLIISDLNMPRMSGIELLEVVRLRDRKTSALNPWGSQRMLLGEEGRLNRKFSLTGKNGLT